MLTSQQVAETALEKWLSDSYETVPVPANIKDSTE